MSSSSSLSTLPPRVTRDSPPSRGAREQYPGKTTVSRTLLYWPYKQLVRGTDGSMVRGSDLTMGQFLLVMNVLGISFAFPDDDPTTFWEVPRFIEYLRTDYAKYMQDKHIPSVVLLTALDQVENGWIDLRVVGDTVVYVNVPFDVPEATFSAPPPMEDAGAIRDAMDGPGLVAR